jgi:hypothetical protein
VLHLRLIIFSVGGNVSVDSETLFVTDLVNLKIKPAQSFGGAHRGRICVYIFIGVNAHTSMSICVCTVFLKKLQFSIICNEKRYNIALIHDSTQPYM